jgi:osmotically inducible protein OsmC
VTQTPTKIVYTASATTTGGRRGRAVSSDGILDVTLTAPKETGGPGTGTNPEQLFAAGYAACFHSALKSIGKKAGADLTDSEVVADVTIGENGEGGFMLAVQLEVTLSHVEHDRAVELVDRAHQVCPYSNATRGNVEVTLTVS